MAQTKAPGGVLSLRDVMGLPSDAEALQQLLQEHHKYCVGALDDDDYMSSEDSDNAFPITLGTAGRINNSGCGRPWDAAIVNNALYYGMPNLEQVFNIRALSRVNCPRTWVVPRGTIPDHSNMHTMGEKLVTNGSAATDYSQRRCIVCARCELLKSPGSNGSLLQKVLAVWPEATARDPYNRPRSSSKDGHSGARLPEKSCTQKGAQGQLYWPAYVTQVVGVFEDPLLECASDPVAVNAIVGETCANGNSVAAGEAPLWQKCRAWLESHDDLNNVISYALQAPMKVCVDVTYCIDEISEGRRLTIAPAIRYPHRSESVENEENDLEILNNAKHICSMLKKGHHCTCMVTCEAQCPILTPEEMPEVVSIRNYSHTGTIGRRRGNATATAAGVTWKPNVDGYNEANSSEGVNNSASISMHSSLTTAKESLPRSRLNNETLSQSPITALEMLAGPICHARQFVYLRPDPLTVAEAQRAAIERLRMCWVRLRRPSPALSKAEAAIQRKIASSTAHPTNEKVKRTMSLHESPYVQSPCRKINNNNPSDTSAPRGPSAPQNVTDDHVQRELKFLQGHTPCAARRGKVGNKAECTQVGCGAPATPDFERTKIRCSSRSASSLRGMRDSSPSRYCRHDSDVDLTAVTEQGTVAGPVGGPSKSCNQSHVFGSHNNSFSTQRSRYDQSPPGAASIESMESSVEALRKYRNACGVRKPPALLAGLTVTALGSPEHQKGAQLHGPEELHDPRQQLHKEHQKQQHQPNEQERVEQTQEQVTEGQSPNWQPTAHRSANSTGSREDFWAKSLYTCHSVPSECASSRETNHNSYQRRGKVPDESSTGPTEGERGEAFTEPTTTDREEVHIRIGPANQGSGAASLPKVCSLRDVVEAQSVETGAARPMNGPAGTSVSKKSEEAEEGQSDGAKNQVVVVSSLALMMHHDEVASEAYEEGGNLMPCVIPTGRSRSTTQDSARGKPVSKKQSPNRWNSDQWLPQQGNVPSTMSGSARALCQDQMSEALSPSSISSDGNTADNGLLEVIRPYIQSRLQEQQLAPEPHQHPYAAHTNGPGTSITLRDVARISLSENISTSWVADQQRSLQQNQRRSSHNSVLSQGPNKGNSNLEFPHNAPVPSARRPTSSPASKGSASDRLTSRMHDPDNKPPRGTASSASFRQPSHHQYERSISQVSKSRTGGDVSPPPFDSSLTTTHRSDARAARLPEQCPASRQSQTQSSCAPHSGVEVLVHVSPGYQVQLTDHQRQQHDQSQLHHSITSLDSTRRNFNIGLARQESQLPIHRPASAQSALRGGTTDIMESCLPLSDARPPRNVSSPAGLHQPGSQSSHHPYERSASQISNGRNSDVEVRVIASPSVADRVSAQQTLKDTCGLESSPTDSNVKVVVRVPTAGLGSQIQVRQSEPRSLNVSQMPPAGTSLILTPRSNLTSGVSMSLGHSYMNDYIPLDTLNDQTKHVLDIFRWSADVNQPSTHAVAPSESYAKVRQHEDYTSLSNTSGTRCLVQVITDDPRLLTEAVTEESVVLSRSTPRRVFDNPKKG
uniref:Uncharacterized protein n=1 Tax=Trypanosoma congolense (strain IL3000) TaxID=1068625 RepID=G0UQU2_TRYCI|nr:conserved hypothetical protein [Trypanosoma congolense IL3000]